MIGIVRSRRPARLALLAGATGAVIASAAWAAGPADWIGRYSFDRIDGSNFWEALGPRLDATIGPPTATLVRRGWGPEVPVARDGEWIIGVACMARDCSENNVTVAISSVSGRVVACTHILRGKGPRDFGTWREAGRAPKTIHPLKECPREGQFARALDEAGIAGARR